jgi:hypothetical protein
MDVGLVRLETARRRVLASRAVPPLSKRRFIARLPRRAVLARDRAANWWQRRAGWNTGGSRRDAGVLPQRPPARLQPAPSRGSSASPARAPKRRFAPTTGAAAQDGAADSEALPVLPIDAARRHQTGAKPGVDDGYGAITRRRTALTRFRPAEASIRCHRENSGVGREISPSGSRSDQRRDGIDAVPRIH